MNLSLGFDIRGQSYQVYPYSQDDLNLLDVLLMNPVLLFLTARLYTNLQKALESKIILLKLFRINYGHQCQQLNGAWKN